jgi:hypothetical protein
MMETRGSEGDRGEGNRREGDRIEIAWMDIGCKETGER